MTDSFNPGQFFILGFEGLDPEKSFLELVETFPPAGFVFLGSNYDSPPQLAALIELLDGMVAEPALFAVDQEPGRVQRLKKGFPLSLTPLQYVSSGGFDEFADWCGKTAAILSEIGINLNLAPVVDLAPFEKSPAVLNDRSFGDNPENVGRFAEILIEEHRKENVLTCAKHFPGLGSSVDDPHARLAASPDPRARFLDYHWKPFRRAVESGADMVMTTHLLASSLDSTCHAGISTKIISRLRESIEFEGAVISDDLLMTGAGDHDIIGETAERSLLSGHNLVIISKDATVQRMALEHLAEKYCSDEKLRGVLTRNESAIAKVKSKISPR